MRDVRGATTDRGHVMAAVLQADQIGPVDVAMITFEGGDFPADVAPALADLRASGIVALLSDADLADLADGLAPGPAALILVWENCWAARFAEAIHDSHGRVAMLDRIPRENVERAIKALEDEAIITGY